MWSAIFLTRVKSKAIIISILLIFIYILISYYLAILRHRLKTSFHTQRYFDEDEIEEVRMRRNITKYLSLTSKAYKYDLSEILMVRIYKEDKAKWTIRELKQWIHYLIYAGVQHVYVCDHFVQTDERLDRHLGEYIKRDIVTYIPWPWNASLNSGNIMKHQVNCYIKVIHEYGDLSKWQMSIDMDEYPVCLNDTKKGFLRRFVETIPLYITGQYVSQILMPNFLMLGQGDRAKDMVIERINRVTFSKANNLTKPLYKPFTIRKADIHFHSMLYGSAFYADQDVLRMLHYWGARLQGWGPDKSAILNSTTVLNIMKGEITQAVRQSLLDFSETDAFGGDTGP